MAYNGWANRATWNVNLWVGNSQWAYGAMMERSDELREQGKVWTQGRARRFAESYFGDRTPDGDKLSGVNWREIAKSFNEMSGLGEYADVNAQTGSSRESIHAGS